MRTSCFKALALAGVMAFLFISCSRNTVLLDYTNAKGEVPQLGNLVFRFDKSLYPDSLVSSWDSSEYISFEPRIRGRFRWNAPDELVFSPEQPLQPATQYKAHVGKEALRFSQYNDIKEGDNIQFHTAPLQLSDAQVTWVLQDESRRLAVPQFLLHFNYPVAAEDIREKLKLTVEGADAPYTVQTMGYSTDILVRLNSFKAEDRNYEARLQLAKGLKPQKGAGTEEEITSSFSIPSPYVLTINNVESAHDGTAGTIHISTSQQVAGQNISQFIRFSPAVKYTVDFDEDGMTLRSDQFNAEEAYSFTIAPGLKGKVGGILREEYEGNAAFGELESDVKFTNSKAIYLSKKGAGNIEVRITNTPKVKIVVSKIYENNLLAAGRNDYTPEEEEEDNAEMHHDEEDGETNSYINNVSGDVIYTKEIDTRSLPRSGNGRILNLSQVEDRLPEMRGTYHVMIRSTKDYWVRDSRFISFSDIGLVAKQGQGKMYVFANSIKTAAPMQAVVVNVYGANNQLVGTGTTNADGAAEVALTTRSFSGFRPAMVIAKTPDDFTYLPFNNTRVSLSRFDVGGKRTNATGLDAYIYAERDIYRPGERLNFSVLLRGRNWSSPGGIPIKLKLLLPNGNELKSMRKTLNEQGATDGNIDITEAAITGSYTLEVYSSNDVLLATKNFMVEEFVPDRLKVTAKLDKPSLRPSETLTLTVNAVNFFGPPAANRNTETEVQVGKKLFTSKKFPNYNFNLDDEHTFFDKEVREGKTDAAGNSIVTYEVPALYANRGLLQASFYTTVFDETGRPVSRVARADIYTQEIFNGIADDGYGYYALNQPARFDLATVNRDGNPVEARASINIIKHEYRTVLVRNGSYFRYESQKEDKIVYAQQVIVHGSSTFNFTPRTAGEYELRMYSPGTDASSAYVSKSFYSYGAWGNDNSSFEVNTEGHVDIDLDKESYATGATANILFKAPFSGRMLVTVETDHVLSYQYLDVPKKTANMSLKLTGDHVPNIYITATLIKPHEVSDIPLTVAHGFKSIKVDDPARHLPVAITAAASTRSHTHQKVRVQAAPGSYVSLAAVDNGVLQVSNFETPDPYAYYYQKKALEVTAFDMYPLLFPELRARLSSTGGDGSLSLDKRVNPMKARRIKIMSYWSGLKKANASGVAEFEFDVPQFNGQLRLMAVAFKDEKFGSAESNMTVADPLVLSSALPRFMSPGDTVLVPVTISNTTAKNATGQATLLASGPVKVIGDATQNVTIGPNGEARANFRVVASPTIGIGHVSVEIRALGEKFTDETEISVRPPSTLQKFSGSGSIVGGGTQQIAIPQNDLLPGSFQYELVVSRSPVAEIAEQLRYLVQYPYGCTEQTVSSAFPQLYYADFSDQLGLKNNSGQLANNNVLEAIRKIKMRQLYTGGVTLWDNEGTENWWATVYAAHFLLEARKAGFDVDNSLIETMLSYLANRLKNKQTIEYYYNRNQNRKIAPKEVAYSLYVLSLAGRAQVAAMNYYKANPQLLALDERYLLSAAYAVSGDRRSFTALLPASFSGEESVRQSGGSFYSALRDEAISLSMLVDVDPGNAQIPVMRRHVSERLKSNAYLNTQERAFSFLALGKIARGEKGATVTAELRANGKTVAHINGDYWKGTSASLGSNTVQLVTKGTGRLYYSWVAEGISATGNYKEEDNYIRVSRRFFDRNGHPIEGTTFHQNDLVIVQLTLDRMFNSTIENVVITDLLPAGFEIENPRTKEIPGMDWIKDGLEPTALDVRDDRIHFFVDATSSRQHYYYAVRAVSLGLFKQGPVSADALYNGEIHSYRGAQLVRVN